MGDTCSLGLGAMVKALGTERQLWVSDTPSSFYRKEERSAEMKVVQRPSGYAETGIFMGSEHCIKLSAHKSYMLSCAVSSG